MFREQAWTVAFSLLSSLFVALLVIPMLCSRLLGERPVAAAEAVPFPRYGDLLSGLLQRRALVALAALVLVAGTVATLDRLGSEFMPRVDQGELSLRLSMPEGTGLARTEGAARNVESLIAQHLGDELDHLYSRVGPAVSAGDLGQVLADENEAVIYVDFRGDSGVAPEALVEALGDKLDAVEDMEVEYLLGETALETSLGRSEAPVVVEIRGPSLETLTEVAVEVESRLQRVEGLTGVESSQRPGRPEIEVVVDRTAAAGFGLGLDAIGSQLASLLSGRDAGQIHQRGEASDIVIRRPSLSTADLERLLLETPQGRRVRLDEVARLASRSSPREILRNNQARVVRINAHLATEEPFDRVAARVGAAVQEISLPPDYRFVIAGEEKLRQESFRNLRFALLLAVVLVYMVMAAQFESLVHPFVILLTIPLAGVGAVALLLALGMPLNVMSFIGVILLAGIAVNDSIILVDRINQNRRAGLDLEAAVVHAARTRIRPIVMTSATTMLALLPLAIGVGEGAALRAPMAVAVIGGLFSCTALTLIVIPCVYHLFARLDRLRPQPEL
jgi:HAE1 family hydrophobic/amphiphilic exporter-1